MESNDSHEILDRGETSDILGLPSGEAIRWGGPVRVCRHTTRHNTQNLLLSEPNVTLDLSQSESSLQHTKFDRPRVWGDSKGVINFPWTFRKCGI